MLRVPVSTAGGRYDIAIGPDLLDRLDDALGALDPTSIAIVSDSTVAGLYGERAGLAAGRVARTQTFVLPASEHDKSLAMVSRVVDQLVDMAADRRTVLFALGGGVVGDITGFAAAVYMRGVAVRAGADHAAGAGRLVGRRQDRRSTTRSGKNMIGAFHQPAAGGLRPRHAGDACRRASWRPGWPRSSSTGRSPTRRSSTGSSANSTPAGARRRRAGPRGAPLVRDQGGVVGAGRAREPACAPSSTSATPSATRSRPAWATAPGCTAKRSAAAWCWPPTCRRARACRWRRRRAHRRQRARAPGCRCASRGLSAPSAG